MEQWRADEKQERYNWGFLISIAFIIIAVWVGFHRIGNKLIDLDNAKVRYISIANRYEQELEARANREKTDTEAVQRLIRQMVDSV